MKADLLIRRRVVYADGIFADLVVWRVPEPIPRSLHLFKYRLVYIVEGKRIIGFDNERGKGDHRHDAGREGLYAFRDVDTLLADFVEAVELWRTQDGKA